MKKYIVLVSFFICFLVHADTDYTAVDNLVISEFGSPTFYCPWRSAYLKDTVENQEVDCVLQKECVFCAQRDAGNDPRYFIIQRFKHHVVMLNAFPCVEGQLLIVPYRHVADLALLTQEEQHELLFLIMFSLDVLKKIMAVDGANVGINVGKASGASVPDHLHTHIVPRKLHERVKAFGDIISGLKLIHWDMQTLYIKLKEGFKAFLTLETKI